jgi:hypothetical protein
LTWASIRALDRVVSIRDAEQTGKLRIDGGKSHSCDRPTSASSRPRAQTISVADESRETTRIMDFKFRTFRISDFGSVRLE